MKDAFYSPYEEFIYKRTYSRYLWDKERREEWFETVHRYMEYFIEVAPKLSMNEIQSVHDAIYNMKVVPSMRLLWSAGECARLNNITGYNCAFMAVDDLDAFSETLNILMSGAGVGYSVEKKYVSNLPVISSDNGKTIFIDVEDSRMGWVNSLHTLLTKMYEGYKVNWSVKKVRKAGYPLKIMGGRSSGPEPLVALFEFASDLISKNRGKRLSPFDCHQLLCKIAEIVVVGGVRRSSLISLFDKDDNEMYTCKSGAFWEKAPHLQMANISVVYDEPITKSEFDDYWAALEKSGTGEPGIFNKYAIIENTRKHNFSRYQRFEENEFRIGCNPCGEIILIDNEFCNLSEIITRPEDTRVSMYEKAQIASLIGTVQSLLTNKLDGLSYRWKMICEQERLLGVSISGQFDNIDLFHPPEFLTTMKGFVKSTNENYARKFGIPTSAATTCVKPSGNTSNLTNCSPGVHPRWSKYFIRRVNISANDPLCKFMEAEGIPSEDRAGTEGRTKVLSFPVKSSANVVDRHGVTSLQLLDHTIKVKKYYCEHNPSTSVYVEPDKWGELGDSVFENFRKLGGITFFPKDDAIYPQAPYEEISKEEYESLMETYPKDINFSLLKEFEEEDSTTGAIEVSCHGGQCFL